VKIQICAPSNAAVDEILSRLITDDLQKGLSHPETKSTSPIVRVAAADYVAASNILPYTLRE
jgi:hypothetical protein